MTEKLTNLIKSNIKDDSIDLSDDIFDELTEEELQQIIDYANKNNIKIIDSLEQEDNKYTTYTNENASDYYNMIKCIPVLPHEEIVELFKKYKNGDNAAKNDIIEHNLRLVVSIANKFHSDILDFDDLVQMGNMGLMRAVESYDYSKNVKFSTYATYWIKQRIIRSIYESQPIHVPVHVFAKILKINTIIAQYMNDNHVEPSNEYLAEQLHITENEIESIKLYAVTNKKVSLSASVGDEEDSTIGDFIPDISQSTEKICFNNALQEIVSDILASDSFKDKEADIIKRRFGLVPYEYPQTLEAVAKEYNCTKEQIRRIEHLACKKLRHPKFKKYLAEFL